MDKREKINYAVNNINILHTAADNFVKGAKKSMSSPCKRGCDHCCYQLVTTSIPEALAALQSVWNNPVLKEEFQAKIPRLEKEVELLRAPNASNSTWFYMNIPCVFLEDHVCTAYKNRPVMCRTHISAEDSSEKCKNTCTEQRIKLVNKQKMLEKLCRTSRDIGEELGIPWSMAPLQVVLLDAWNIYTNGTDYVKKRTLLEELELLQYWAQLELRP